MDAAVLLAKQSFASYCTAVANCWGVPHRTSGPIGLVGSGYTTILGLQMQHAGSTYQVVQQQHPHCTVHGTASCATQQPTAAHAASPAGHTGLAT